MTISTVRNWKSPKPAILGALVLTLLTFASSPCSTAATPDLERVEKIVAAQMARKRDYRPGDLISQADVEPIFNRLRELGLQPSDRETLYDAFLPHNSFLVREMSTPDGVKFMRAVSKYPEVYDRLERLSWMPAGRELIREMIQRPDGPEVLRSLTTPAGAKAVEKIMAGDIRGANFALPTGHVHTAEQLIEQLRQSHQSGKATKSPRQG